MRGIAALAEIQEERMGMTRAIALTVAAVATALTVAPGAHASAPVGTITSPTAGTTAKVGTTITVTATTDGVCAPSLQVRTPGGATVKVAMGDPGPMCGQVSFGGNYVPDASGAFQVALMSAKGDTLAEVAVTAVTPPTATPTVTETVTATPTPEQTKEATATGTPTPSPTPTVTKTVTATPKATATKSAKATPRPTVTKTVKEPAPQAQQPAPQVIVQQPADTPQDATPTLDASPVASATQAAPVQVAPSDQIPAWLAYQLASERDNDGAGFGTAVAAVFTVLVPIIAVGAGAFFLITRKRGQRRYPL
ncbi:hypothetical protein ACIHFD_49815 [Nonomuraea sp. NPDC051941]|uniref:hypothetical protein n=1 Tax=Nonomuraea sp. NPDC051941 TaxID=3364373 RepID=UPI0037C64E77